MDMKSVNKIIALLAFVLSMAVGHSQAQGIKIDFDKKVIYTDSLNLPSNCIAKNILNILPELLERPGYLLLNKYDIKIDDVSVGEALDGALSQLRLSDIEKIEVDESPISSYQNYGQSGSINIWLRNKPSKEKKTWGSISTDMTLPFNLLPKFTMTYMDEKINVRGFVLGDIYEDTHHRDYQDYADGQLYHSTTAKDVEKYWSDMARVYINYTPDEKNSIKLDVSQVAKLIDQSFTKNDSKGFQKTYDESRLIRTNLLYKHECRGKSLFKAEVEFDYQPLSSTDKKPQTRFYVDNKVNSVAGKISFMQHLPIKNQTSNPASIEAGIKGRFDFTESDNRWEYTNSSPTKYFFNKFKGNNFNPYIESKNAFGQFRIKGVVELQCFHYNINMYTHDTYTHNIADVAGKLMAEWHFTPHRNIRFILDRKILLPSYEQIFPYQFTNPKKLVEFFGNEKLKNTYSHEASIDYNSDYQWDNRTLLFNVGTSFNNVSNLIREKELSKTVQTFVNEGKNLIFNQNFMARYSYKHFAVALTANLYHYRLEDIDNPDSFHYFNVCLLPSITLPNGWEGLIRLLYTSQVKTNSSTLGECTHMSFNLGKWWGRFNLHCYGRFSLRGKTHDIAYSNNTSQYTYYYMPESAFGVGMNYSF